MGCVASKNHDSHPCPIEDHPPAYEASRNARNPETKMRDREEERQKEIPKNFLSWQEKAEQYVYEIWISKSTMDNATGRVQLRLLRYLQQLSMNSSIYIEVRCLDFVQDPGNSTSITLQNMLDCLDLERLQQLLDQLPKTTRFRDRISAALSKAKENVQIDETTALGLVRGAVLIALAPLSKVWTLQEFVREVEQIKQRDADITGTRDMKIQAQVISQGENARAIHTTELGGQPKVIVNLVPPSITNSSYTNIRREFDDINGKVLESNKERGQKGRQDLVSFQFVSFGAKSTTSQWTKLDNLRAGALDIIDSVHIDVEKLEKLGPGLDLLLKILLGAVDEELDKNKSPQLYGKGWIQGSLE